jgi:hypothetical protein
MVMLDRPDDTEGKPGKRFLEPADAAPDRIEDEPLPEPGRTFDGTEERKKCSSTRF